jgi:hypothetical protein
MSLALVAELVDASVSKTDERELVPVRFRSGVLGLSIKALYVLNLQGFFFFNKPAVQVLT